MKTTWKPHEKHGDLTERSDLPDNVFAFPTKRKEPMTDASHVRNAIARFDQTIGVSDEDRELAFANIKKAAAHYGVEWTNRIGPSSASERAPAGLLPTAARRDARQRQRARKRKASNIEGFLLGRSLAGPNGEVLCEQTASPMCSSCRALLARGITGASIFRSSAV